MPALLLAALLAATPPVGPVQPPPPTFLNKPAEKPPPASVWKVGKGDAEHLESGLRCPPAFGPFKRVDLAVFDGFGLDVGCGYNAPTAAITVYLTRGWNDAYEGTRQGVEKAGYDWHPKLVGEDQVSDGGISWRRARYTGDDGRHSDAWVADLHGWALIYRATYPETETRAVAAALEEITATVRASAALRLGLCERSSAPARPGKPVPEREQAKMAMMGALVNGVGVAAAKEKGAPDAAPLTWCVEGPAPTEAAPLLAWRGVTPDGKVAPSDRLTVMSVGEPVALDTTLDELGNIIAGELTKGKAPERWIATVSSKSGTTIFGYFDKRPSAEELSPLMLQILSGKARSLGGHSADGLTINIPAAPKK